MSLIKSITFEQSRKKIILPVSVVRENVDALNSRARKYHARKHRTTITHSMLTMKFSIVEKIKVTNNVVTSTSSI
jgi:hypothetical protein